MSRVLIWDHPMRLCHWGFALSLSASLVIGLRCDPESAAFPYHMLLGFIALWFMAVRVILGFIGSRHARWRSFFHGPRQTLRYFANVIRWNKEESGGPNAGSALFAQAIYLATLALIWTGFVPDWVESWHGWLAYAAIALIGVHLLGLSLHALRHRALTPLSMIHGRGIGRETDALPSSQRLAGLIVLILSAILIWAVFARFDTNTATLHLPFLPEIDLPLIQKG
jgi:cytochrome b